MSTTIWGHETVHIEKDPAQKTWRVYTLATPRQLLVEVKWADALRPHAFAYAKDYSAALQACMRHPTTALSRAEMRALEKEQAQALAAEKQPAGTPPSPTAEPQAKVVSFAAYKKKRGL